MNSPSLLPTVTAWGRVAILVGAGVAGAWQVGKGSAALPVLRVELTLSLLAAGWVLSIFNAVAVLTGSFAGAVADMIGHRRLLLGGLVIAGLASLAGSLSQAANFLLLTRLLEGVGYLIILVSAPALVVRSTAPRDMDISLGIWGAFMPLGTSTMMVLSPWLIEAFGWRGLWRVNGLALLAYTGLVWLTTRDLVRTAGQRVAPGWPGRLLRDITTTATTRGPLVLALCFGAYALMFLAVMGFLPTMLVEDEGYSLLAATGLTALVVFVNAPGNVLGGWLLRRGAPRWLLVASVFIIMGFTGFGIYAESLPDLLRYGLCLTFFFIGGILPGVAMAGAAKLAPRPDLVSTSNGLIMQGSNLGTTLGPPLLALIVSSGGGWGRAPWLLAGAAVVGLLLSLALRPLERRD